MMKFRCVIWWNERDEHWCAATVQHQHRVFGQSIMKAINNLRGNLSLELAFIAGDSDKKIVQYYKSARRSGSTEEDRLILEKSQFAEPVPTGDSEVDVKRSYYCYVPLDHTRFKSCAQKLKRKGSR